MTADLAFRVTDARRGLVFDDSEWAIDDELPYAYHAPTGVGFSVKISASAPDGAAPALGDLCAVVSDAPSLRPVPGPRQLQHLAEAAIMLVLMRFTDWRPRTEPITFRSTGLH